MHPARSQPQNSKGAPATSKGARNLHPKKVVAESPSQPLTARGPGGAAVSSPSGVWGGASAANDFGAFLD